MMRRSLVALLFGLVFLAPPAHADDAGTGTGTGTKLEGAALDSTLADIAKARKDLRTMTAQFTQDRKIALLATSVKSRGELTFAAPDRLRWDLAPPDDVVYFVGPEGLSYKTKSSTATMPATGANVARGLADLRALLGGDLSTLKERYVLGGSKNADGSVEITGTAKEKGPVRAFALTVEPQLVKPLRARLFEGKSDSVDLVFSNVVVNAPVDPARLRP